jgi:AcrR family transcriptional regulator
VTTPQRAVPRGRRPGPNDTREDILAAARDLFSQQGYEKASMRAIARRAKVDPALIVHYFDSKEGLLTESLALPLDPARVLHDALRDVSDDEIGEALARTVLGLWGRPALRQRLLSMLRVGMSHEVAMGVLRQTFSRTVLAAVARLVDDDTAALRAELVATQMIGLMMARFVMRLPQVAEADIDELSRLVGPSVQLYLTGPLDVRGAS